LEGRPYIFIDNINQRIDSGVLSAATTTGTFSDRVLGESRSTPVPVRCVWVMAANNPLFSNEIARRTVRCRMNANDEHPHLRLPFKHEDLAAWTRQHRGELVAAVYTLVNAWLAAGRPKHRGTRLGSYGSWSDVMGGILATAGIPGFLSNMVEFFLDADDIGSAWRAFLADWWDEHGPTSVAAGSLIRLAQDAGLELPADPSKRDAALGRDLKKQLDNVYGDLAVRTGDRIRGKGTTYRLAALDGREWTAPEPFVVDPFGVDHPTGVTR